MAVRKVNTVARTTLRKVPECQARVSPKKKPKKQLRQPKKQLKQSKRKKRPKKTKKRSLVS